MSADKCLRICLEFENLKTFCILIFLGINQVPNVLKKSIKNGITGLKTGDFDVFNASNRKYRVRHRQNCLMKFDYSLKTISREKTPKYL